jgi:uncharacterized protein YlzI (FlbEa/FlbD family)
MILKFTLDDNATLIIDSKNIESIYEDTNIKDKAPDVILSTISGKEFMLKHSIEYICSIRK